MAQFPADRFDELPDDVARVGAHRAPRGRGAGWIGFAWAALASGILVIAGLWGLSLITDRVSFEIPSFEATEPMPTPTTPSSAPPSIEPITNPDDAELPDGFTITILNGAGVTGLGQTAGGILSDADWRVGTVTSAAQDDLEQTVVYYNAPELEAVALGLASLLGTGSIELSDAFPGAPVTIAIGADFAALQQ